MLCALHVTNDNKISSISSSLGLGTGSIARVLFGYTTDRLGYPFASALNFCFLVCLLGTFGATAYGGAPMFLIWTAFLYSANYSCSTILCSGIKKYFRERDFPTVFGVIDMNKFPAAVRMALYFAYLFRLTGWSWFVVVLAALMTIPVACSSLNVWRQTSVQFIHGMNNNSRHSQTFPNRDLNRFCQ